jgi:hypothetical protein
MRRYGTPLGGWQAVRWACLQRLSLKKCYMMQKIRRLCEFMQSKYTALNAGSYEVSGWRSFTAPGQETTA